MEAAIVLTRFVQIAAGMIVCGAPLFFLYGVAPSSALASGWARRLLSGAGVLGAVAAIGWLMAQSATFGDGPADAFDPAKVWSVAADTSVGRAGLARAALFAAAALAPWFGMRERRRWIACTIIGALAAASLSRLGHGEFGEGAGGVIHLGADVVHLLTAAVWIGALAPLAVLMIRSGRSEADRQAAHTGLEGFSGIGPLVVALLVGSGVANSLFLVAPDQLVRSAYGVTLLVKLFLFALMLGLAAANRYRLTPALSRGLDGSSGASAALSALRASIVAETALGVAVLACVAWLGVLAPPSAG